MQKGSYHGARPFQRPAASQAKDAGRIAGLEVVHIINEPTAAALAYGLHATVGKAANASRPNMLIFDLGGGNFDISVLSMDGGVFAVKAIGGDTHLGGEDFDNCMVDWCQKKIEEKHGKNTAKVIKSSSRSTLRLRRACESAKRMLSLAQEAVIAVDSLFEGETFSATLTRACFRKVLYSFTRCMDTVKSVIKDAGATITASSGFTDRHSST